MAVAEEQQQQRQAACSDDANAAHLLNQSSSKSAQNSLKYGVDKMQVELRTTEFNENVAMPLSDSSNGKLQTQHCRESSNKAALDLAVGLSAPIATDDNKGAEIAAAEAGQSYHQHASNGQTIEPESVGDDQSDGCATSIKETIVLRGVTDELIVDMEVNGSGIETRTGHNAIVNKAMRMTQQMNPVSAVFSTKADVKMATDMETTARNHTNENMSDMDVANVVNALVTTLVNHVVDLMARTVSEDIKCSKTHCSVIYTQLGANKAISKDEELLIETRAFEDEIRVNHEYQWFDGDEDDEDGAAVEIGPSFLGTRPDAATAHVLGYERIASSDDTAYVIRDGSGDTLVLAAQSRKTSTSTSTSTSSSSSSLGASSSGSSCNSESASSEEQHVCLASTKRRILGRSDPCKRVNYKEKRVRSETEQQSPRRPFKRKRHIPPPVIPPEFAVFETKALDPILRGSYAVQNNRRASFVGSWGFCEEDFQETNKVSPFEYISRARVHSLRHKDDNRPVSGKYGGFFQMRRFNGSLVKVREDQVDLQFIPMPLSDGEDEDRENVSNEDDKELLASRYVVLGKGKNRFGRFLIRGYLNPNTGRLSVKRRYLE